MVVERECAVRVPTALVERDGRAVGRSREVAPVDDDAIDREADDRRVSRHRRVVGGRVEAPRAEGVTMEVWRAAAATDMLVARVHLTILGCEQPAVVVDGVDFLTRDRPADVAAHG